MAAVRRKQRLPASSISDIRSMNSNDLILSCKWCLAFTAVLLLYGLPFAATCVSAFGLVLFPFQTKSFAHLLKDLRKWVLLSAFAFVASLKSYLILELAAKTEDDCHAYWLWLSGTVIHEVAGAFLAYCLYIDHRKEADNSQSTVQFLEVRIRILKGRNLVAKDYNIFGKPTTSDPYVKVLHNNHYVGETSIVRKTLNPEWEDELFCLPVVRKALGKHNQLELNILDRDKFTTDDKMGTVLVTIPKTLNLKVKKWYKVGKGSGRNYCPNPTGELQVEVELRQLLSKNKRFQRQISRKSDPRTFASTRSWMQSKRRTIVEMEGDDDDEGDALMMSPAAKARLGIPEEESAEFSETPTDLTSVDNASEVTDEMASLMSSPIAPKRRKTLSPFGSGGGGSRKRFSARLQKKLPRLISLSPQTKTKKKTAAKRQGVRIAGNNNHKKQQQKQQQ
ncbi:MAG: hypothetical protein SGBAC_007514 [Bacillariaceae sp.]